MDKLILSELKSTFNNKQFVDAFNRYLSAQQDFHMRQVLSAKNMEEVARHQGSYITLENLKSLRDVIIEADKNGNK